MDWLALTLIGAFLIAIATIFQKNILKKEHTFEFTVILYLAGCIFLIPAMINIDFSIINMKTVGLIAIRGIFAATGFLFLTKAYRHADISVVSPMKNLSPIFLVVLSFFFLRETLGMFELFGIFLIIFGTYFLELDKSKGFFHPLKEIVKSKSFHYLLVMFVLWSFCIIIEKQVLTTTEISIYSLLAISYPISAAWLLGIYFVMYKSFKNLIYSIKHYGLFTALVSGIEMTSAFFHLSAVAIPTAKVSLIVPIRRMASVVEVIIGGKIFNETHLLQKAVATMIMVSGVFLIV